MGRLTKAELREYNAEHNTQFKLTPYHKDLYEYIRHNTDCGIKTTVKMICDFMPEYYNVVLLKHNKSNCPTLYWDIDYINRSPETTKTIIKDNNNFKVATKEEAERYAANMRIRALRLLAKAGVVKVKSRRDGQGYVPETKPDTIDNDEDFVRAFIEEGVDEVGTELKQLDCQIVCSRLTRD